MTTYKLAAGNKLPEIAVPLLGGGTTKLTDTTADSNWKMIVVYRGKHCPLCAQQLATLKLHMPDFIEQGIDVVVISSDSEEKARAQMAELQPKFDVGYDLSVAQMQALGLYVSNPRSDAETDRPFAEPGLFVINADGDLQFINLANAPFLRPDFGAVLMGISFVRNPDNDYPIRGTRAYS